jgi:type IV pilus assembly protein PilE
MKRFLTLSTISFTIVCLCIVVGNYLKELKIDNVLKESLSEIYNLETAYKEMFDYYTDNSYALGFIQDTLVIDGGVNYLISILDITDSTFTATAVSVVDFDNDGQFNTWSVNEKGIITEIIED